MKRIKSRELANELNKMQEAETEPEHKTEMKIKSGE
jgi:hypothetical protein